jgi:hypothetical protein
MWWSGNDIEEAIIQSEALFSVSILRFLVVGVSE